MVCKSKTVCAPNVAGAEFERQSRSGLLEAEATWAGRRAGINQPRKAQRRRAHLEEWHHGVAPRSPARAAGRRRCTGSPRKLLSHREQWRDFTWCPSDDLSRRTRIALLCERALARRSRDPPPLPAPGWGCNPCSYSRLKRTSGGCMSKIKTRQAKAPPRVGKGREQIKPLRRGASRQSRSCVGGVGTWSRTWH